MAAVSDPVVAELFARCEADHLAWLNGDASGYALPEDGTILGAFGAYGRGGPEVAARQAAGAKQFASGTGAVELLAAEHEGGLICLVMVERGQVTFADASEPTRWDLRVTEVFRQVGDGWERVHRHADPLVDFHPLPEILGLLGASVS